MHSVHVSQHRYVLEKLRDVPAPGTDDGLPAVDSKAMQETRAMQLPDVIFSRIILSYCGAVDAVRLGAASKECSLIVYADHRRTLCLQITKSLFVKLYGREQSLCGDERILEHLPPDGIVVFLRILKQISSLPGNRNSGGFSDQQWSLVGAALDGRTGTPGGQAPAGLTGWARVLFRLSYCLCHYCAAVIRTRYSEQVTYGCCSDCGHRVIRPHLITAREATKKYGLTWEKLERMTKVTARLLGECD